MPVSIRCLVVVLLFSMVSPAHAREKLTLCSADSPPWTIQRSSDPSDIEGIAVDLMIEMFRRAHADIEMVALPFKRCLENTESGKLDGCFMTIKNEQREAYAEFTDPYLNIPTYIYYSPDKIGKFEWEKWEDLEPYRIGVQRGFKYGRDFTKALNRIPMKLVEVSDVDNGVAMLFMDRIDLILINEFRYEYLLRRHPEYRGLLSRARKPVAVGRVHVAISKKSPNAFIIARLNAVIAEMTADGSIEKIVRPTPSSDSY